jgi:hypothetical protein
LYKGNTQQKTGNQTKSHTSFESDIDSDTDEDSIDDSNDSDIDDDSDELQPDIANALNRIRKIVILFKRSPLKNDILQKYVKLEYGQENLCCSIVALDGTASKQC